MTGQTISHFKVLEKLGGGGMGVVYLAENLKLGSKVALKFLPPHLATDAEAKERFVQEARAASALNHANICTVHDIDETEDGQLFIAMAHYEGETLKAKLERGALPTEEAVEIARHVAEGLSAAHEKGIIHRDIKPANIFITKRGRAVILDFGLAKLAGALDLTKSGSTLGTAYYMSPEQIRGEPVDQRTDVWSLGVVLYEMLSAQRPFTGDYEQAISYAILNEEPPRLLNQSAFLEGIVGEALRKKAGQRTESASKLAERLKAVSASSDSGSIPPPQAIQQGGRWRVAAVLALVSVTALAVWLWSQPPSQTVGEKAITLVVLPFENIGSPQYEFMGRGIAEDIASRMMAVRNIELRATRSAVDLVAQGKSLSEIGKDLNVEFVLDGSVQATESQVRLSPKLIRVTDEVQLWGDTFDGDSRDALEFQSKVATAIVDNLGIALGIDERKEMAERPTENQQAYRAYLKGVAAAMRSDKIRFFEQAVALDSTFAKANMQLVRLYSYRLKSSADVLPEDTLLIRQKALNAVRRLESSYPNSVEALVAMGYYEAFANRNNQSALTHLQKAGVFNSSDPDALEAMGFVQAGLGLFEEAIESLERAIVLDPGRAAVAAKLAKLYFGLGHHEVSHDWANKAIELAPLNRYHYQQKARFHYFVGSFREARTVLEMAPPGTSRLNEIFEWVLLHMYERNLDAIITLTDSLDTVADLLNWELEMVAFRATALRYSGRDPGNLWVDLLTAARSRGTGAYKLYFSSQAFAALGEKDSLIASVTRFVDFYRYDQEYLPRMIHLGARFLAMGGLHEDALAYLEELAALPYREYYSHKAVLGLVYFDPLRDDPRFQELMENW